MQSRIRGCLVALLASGGATLARFAVASPLDPEVAQAFSYPAIALGAWLGGLGPGLATTGLCTLAGLVIRFYVGPDAARAPSLSGSVVLLVTGVVLSTTMGRARRSEERLTDALASLEREARGRADIEAALARDKQWLEETLVHRDRIAARHEAAWKDAERRRHELQLLAELTHQLNALLDVELLLKPLAAAVRDLCRADRVAVALRDTGGFRLRCVIGERPAEILEQRYLPIETGAAARVVATGEPYRSGDSTDRIAAEGEIETDRSCPPAPAMMIVPIRIGAGIEGLIVVRGRAPDAFGKHDEELVVRVSDIAAVAIRNAELLAGEQTAREAAEARSRAKDEFLAMLGHELRNPLGTIASAIAAVDLLGEQWQRLQQLVGRQTRHLGRLLDDLLDVSRVAVGKIVLQRQPVDLRDIADHALKALRAEGKGADRRLEWSGQSVWVHGDAARLEQVVRNLLDNAVKYTPPGGRVHLTVAQERDEAVLRVRDTGIGIAPDMLTRVFDVFVQQPRGLDRAEGGLGLGLNLIKRLVELHGGTVSAASPGVDQGSEFVVRLPAVGRSASEAPAIDMTVPMVRRRVAVVEDQADAREALEAFLRLAGHEVEAAPDGEAGLELILRTHPDLALIDIGLPRLDGYEVARRLRSAEGGAGLYLVAVTGYGQPHDRVRALEAGFNDHLVKPLDPEALNRLLARTA